MFSKEFGVVIYEQEASYFDQSAYGGNLRMTEEHLEFIPANPEKLEDFRLSREDMNDVSCFKIYDTIPSGFSIQMKDGSEYNFVVVNRKEWMERINAYLAPAEMLIA